MHRTVRRPAHRVESAGDRGLRRAAAAAIAVAAVGVLLIGGIPSLAAFAASATGSSLAISSGSLTARVTGPVVGTTTPTPVTGVVVRPGASGMVPGVQGQTLTYTVTNNGTARAVATLSVRVLSTAVAPDWATVSPSLGVTAAIGGSAPVAITVGATGIDQTVSSTTVIGSGSSTAVVLTFALTSDPRTLAARSSSSTAVNALVTMAPVFTLTQAPLAGS